MKLIEVVTGPWAIRPETLLEIQGIYASHLRGEKIDLSILEAKLGRKLDNKHGMILSAGPGQQVDNSFETFSVVNGVAVIPVHDVIAKRMNIFMSICGGASTELIKRDIQRALDARNVKAIILYTDSPGGTVDGTAELADYIYSVRGQKPLVAFTDGQVCSAAYWIASACDSVWISSNTNLIGSIGVVAGHRDISQRETMMGVKTTEITAGKYKRIASAYAPLTAEGMADIQDKVDYLYSVFVDDVARNRGVTADQVVKDMADGRVFTGKQNIDNGLVDGVSTMDDLIAQLTTGQAPGPAAKPTKQKNNKAMAGAAEVPHIQQEEGSMDLQTLKKDHPGLVAQIENEAKAGMVPAADVAAGRVAVCALVSAAFGEEPGKKFASCVEKGLIAEDITSLGISFTGASQDDKESRQEILSALKDGQKPLRKTSAGEADEKDYMSLVKAYRSENKDSSLADAMKAVAKTNPEAHAAYVKEANEGRK